MDVIKPEFYWVNDRCYRRNPSKNSYDLSQPTNDQINFPSHHHPSENRPYVEVDEFETCEMDGSDEDEDSCKYVLHKIGESGYKTFCDNIPSSLFPVIIGSKGSTKKRLEMETKTKIVVPRINEKGDIMVRGQNRKDVLNARRRLDNLVSQARFKRDITHFSCFPMNTESVIKKFKQFKEKVLEDFGGTDIDESIFQTGEKLHVTITGCTLLDRRERDEIVQSLKSLSDNIKNLLGNRKHSIQLKGLEIMNDDPSAVDVLYAKCILQDDTIQTLANFVKDELEKTGYCKPRAGENVKLHVTLINSRYRADTNNSNSGDGGGNRGSWRPRVSFDAREILQKYGDFDFGTVDVNEICIVTRHTTAKDGFYNTLASMDLSS